MVKIKQKTRVFKGTVEGFQISAEDCILVMEIAGKARKNSPGTIRLVLDGARKPECKKTSECPREKSKIEAEIDLPTIKEGGVARTSWGAAARLSGPKDDMERIQGLIDACWLGRRNKYFLGDRTAFLPRMKKGDVIVTHTGNIGVVCPEAGKKFAYFRTGDKEQLIVKYLIYIGSNGLTLSQRETMFLDDKKNYNLADAMLKEIGL